MSIIKACIFDLDGVIVDTAKYHFLAWRRLAAELGFDFTEADNERLKGVSRMRSLDILLEVGGIDLDDRQKEEAAARKNGWYVAYISDMNSSEILPGVANFLVELKQHGIRIALGSASKNAHMILGNIGMLDVFDAIIDGNQTANAKPDPEVFLLAAKALHALPENCIVFEDAEAGLEAAVAAGMRCIGVGSPILLKKADFIIQSFEDMTVSRLSFGKVHF